MAWQRHPHFEVVVVNGPSTDATEEVLVRYAGRIRIARCPEANLSLSRNIGMAMAAGDIVAYTDDDAVPEPDWLEALCGPYADPSVGAVGGFIRDHTGYAWQCRIVACDRYGDNEGFVDLAHAQKAGVAMRVPGSKRYLSPTGANSSFRRTALLEVGGFDEEYAYFLDETDVAVRLIDAGWAVTYEPRAEVHHKYAESHLRDASRIPRTPVHRDPGPGGVDALPGAGTGGPATAAVLPVSGLPARAGRRHCDLDPYAGHCTGRARTRGECGDAHRRASPR